MEKNFSRKAENDYTVKYQRQITQDRLLSGRGNYADIRITLKRKRSFFTFVAHVTPPPRGVYPLIFHDPWLRDEENGKKKEKRKRRRRRRRRRRGRTEKEFRPSRGDRFPLVLASLLHLFFSSRAGKSISSLCLRWNQIRRTDCHCTF